MASWLDARAHKGQWLLRMEDVDTGRTKPGAAETIIQQLHALGFRHDGDILWQTRRFSAYQAAFNTLQANGLVYACGCTRREIADSQTRLCQSRQVGDERPYPGTCRNGLAVHRQPRSWRLRVPPGRISFRDRWQGLQSQDVADEVGDFVLKRADGLWAYQLAVVVDDIGQHITDIVRGHDLLSSTARQYLLFDLFGQPRPRVMHVPLVTLDDGRKLSKQNGAAAIDTRAPLQALMQAWRHLGFDHFHCDDVTGFWQKATHVWSQRFLGAAP